MRGRAALAIAPLLLAACAQEAAVPPPPAPVALDCAKGFEALVAEALAQTLEKAPGDPAEPYEYYSSPDGRLSYLITDPGAPAHPAIMMQRSVTGDIRTSGCGFGDQAAYDQLHAYLDSLKTWTQK